MQYYKCDSCQEAFFLTEEARARHYAICVAVKTLASLTQVPTYPADVRPQAPVVAAPKVAPLDLTTRKRSAVVNNTAAMNPMGTSASLNTELPSDLTSIAGPSRTSMVTADSEQATTPSTAARLQWEIKRGLKSARDYIIRNPGIYMGNAEFLEAAIPVVIELLRDELDNSVSMRYSLLLESTYVHPDESRQLLNFKTRSSVLFADDNSEDELHARVKRNNLKILQEEGEHQAKKSGWSLDMPATLTLKVSRFLYKTPSGSSYLSLPKKLRTRQAIVNVQNRDEYCFKYAVLSKHIPNVTAKTILTERSFADMEDIYNFDGLRFPLKATEIKQFEKKNPNTTVNLFECGPEGLITPWRVGVHEKQDHIDLLLYKNKEGDSHYVYIMDFAKLIKPQLAQGRNNITVCKRCYSFVETRRCTPNSELWLQEHTQFCAKHKATPVRLPVEGKNLLKFTQFETQIPVPIIVVADFESCLQPAARTDNAYQEHVPNSFCTLINSTLPDSVLNEVGITTTPHLHRSENAGKEFLLYMQDLAKRVEVLYTKQVPLGLMSAEETEHHNQSDVCDLCDNSFNNIDVIKTLDHCHITGAYRHTLCSSCNLRGRLPNFIPVYFHNLTNYDQAFIISNLGVLKGCKVKAIPSSTEKFISISVRVGRMWVRFLDSYRLLSSSLATLAGNLEDYKLIESSKLVPSDMIELIKRKGVYPYDYVKSHDVFEETSLPPEKAFFNTLNDSHVDSEDYKHAKNVWNSLNMQRFADYHDFYLRLDVCLLMDVLIDFRKTCLRSYRLDCCHHFTAPGLAFRAMLRMTSVTLELMTDSEQLLMIESAVRGGLVQCNIRYARANNKMLECLGDYRAEEDTSHLLFLDCTNLYGYSMSCVLPTGNFKWVDTVSLDWANLAVDSPNGLILECDVEYPDTVHDHLQELPPLPIMSKPPGGKTCKLLATLTKKSRYVAHYTVFQQALQLGLKVTKIYRALEFTQSAWMKRFITLNANLRAKTDVLSEKDFYKLMNNSCFGKSMENTRRQLEVKIATCDSSYQKLIRSPRYEEHTIISDDVVTVRMRRKSVLMNKPIYVGMCVLDISKVHFYNFFYNVLKRHFHPGELSLLYADTDSYLLHCTTERDLYTILKTPTLSCHLDRSVFPNGHPLKCDENKGRIGTFKDETKGRTILEYVGLRPKMYAYRFSSESSKLKAKGIKTAYVDSNLRFQHYKDTLFNTIPSTRPEKAQFNLIRSKKFKLYSTNVTKKSLSSEDDKRHILDCGIRTLPYGHYKLRDITEEDSVSSDYQSDSD